MKVKNRIENIGLIKFIRFTILLIILTDILLFRYDLQAQNSARIELVNANSLSFDKNQNKEIKKLIGQVILRHNNAYLYCDSAYLYSESNKADAFGNVHIKNNDTLNIYSEMLTYDGDARIADLRNNVRLVDKDIILSTDILNYDLSKDIAKYNDWGKIVNKDNYLTSKKGLYYTTKKEFIFSQNVNLKNRKYDINCDSLKYQTKRRIAYFYGPTRIITDGTFIYCEYGWYNIQKDISRFSKKAHIFNKSQKVYADSIIYDRLKSISKAYRNVTLKDTAQKVQIECQFAEYDEIKSTSYATGKPLLKYFMENDTLYIHADTLKSIYDTMANNKVLFAYKRAKFIMKDMQGMSDSLTYSINDSVIHMYKTPILWADKNQMTSDSIEIKTSDRKIKRMYMYENSFISSEEDSGRYNQIRGKRMTADFDENKLKTILVEGNGQTLYYAIDDEKTDIGVNKAEATNLRIYIKSRKIDKINFINSADATLYPNKELKKDELFLKDFKWYSDKRPVNINDLYKW